MPLITVIVAELSESPALLEAGKQLKELGVSFELIPARTWSEGFKMAHGDYICFLEPQSRLSENYFRDIFAVFNDKTNYRKLAMVSSAAQLGQEKIFGFVYDGKNLTPSHAASSSEPYGVQIGYLPGAVIRRSTLNRVEFSVLGVPIYDSQEICLSLWQHGLRCMINPSTLYSSFPAQMPKFDTVHPEIEPIRMMWGREMIG